MKVEGRVIGTQDVVVSSQSGDEEGIEGKDNFFFFLGGGGRRGGGSRDKPIHTFLVFGSYTFFYSV